MNSAIPCHRGAQCNWPACSTMREAPNHVGSPSLPARSTPEALMHRVSCSWLLGERLIGSV
jgi:hypothetical protein